MVRNGQGQTRLTCSLRSTGQKQLTGRTELNSHSVQQAKTTQRCGKGRKKARIREEMMPICILINVVLTEKEKKENLRKP